MNIENTKKLMDAFPKLYRRNNPSWPDWKWSFECGDGWFDLIYKLSLDIEEKAAECGLDKNSEAWPIARQVKEKFGTLRFYVNASLPELEAGSEELPGCFVEFRPVSSIATIRELVDVAESKSKTICEKCGGVGVLRNSKSGWWHVMCDVCEKAHEKEEKNRWK